MGSISDRVTRLRRAIEVLSQLDADLSDRESFERVKESLETLQASPENLRDYEFEHAPALAKFLSDLANPEVRDFFKDYGFSATIEGSPDSIRDFDLAKEAYARLRLMRTRLVYDNEFATRYPETCALLFGEEEGEGLLLPSFGIHVAYHDPQKDIDSPFVPRKYIDLPLSGGSADAHSKTWPRTEVGGSEVLPAQGQSGLFLSRRGHLRGVLLAVLSRDEYWERINAWRPDHVLGFDPSFVYSPVRVTDLRLATDLKPRVLRRQLAPVLRALQRPITAEQVVRWKRQVLKKPTKLVEQAFGDQETGIIAVSFAAAALFAN